MVDAKGAVEHYLHSFFFRPFLKHCPVQQLEDCPVLGQLTVTPLFPHCGVGIPVGAGEGLVVGVSVGGVTGEPVGPREGLVVGCNANKRFIRLFRRGVINIS